MPAVDEATAAIINLYERCKAMQCLPFGGALADQPEWLMCAFDSINATKIKVREEQEEAQQNDFEKQRILKGWQN